MANGQQTTQIAREAPFLEDYRRRLLDTIFAPNSGLASQRIPQFERRISQLSQGEQAGIDEAQRSLGIDPTSGQQTGVASFRPFIDQAQSTMALGIPSLQAAQTQFDPSTANTSAFMNQYQADVTQQALKQLDEQAAKASAQLAGQATKGGTFGGARYGVQQAELAKNLQDIKSKRIFEDLSRNFMQAQQQAIGTSEANRARQLQAAPVYGQIGTGIGNLGAQQFGLQQQGIQSLLGTGNIQRTRDQALADEAFRFQTAQGMEPRQRISFASDILSRTPSVQQSITQQPFPYTNPLAAAAGMGISALGGLGAFYNQGQ
jgi:hypothetical protein|tara:strand:+ start:705 stop:1658 length:954 start_codon:yes stop_codon:yes gene_type:complete